MSEKKVKTVKTSGSSKNTPAIKKETKSVLKKTKSTSPSKEKPAIAKAKSTQRKVAKSKKAIPDKKVVKKSSVKRLPPAGKYKIIRARILSYRRDKRLQTTNQAIAKVLDDYNHQILLGKKFTIKFPESEAIAKGTVIATHGHIKSKLLRVRFENAGMSAYAINQIAEIQIK